ncbi:MAG: hypothetical protein LBE84_11185 [Planctomycetota bacterium]|jgi:hypothetical protein|nr:hypothetical protein [Planctomycetota bacterium]
MTGDNNGTVPAARSGENRREAIELLNRIFGESREAPIMADVYRLAVKCFKEGWLDG